ncbi:MAG: aminotransferase class IV [Deltaproteobacteria bacterium]|nr:aminotransferase class IV [Deltaproteobacteria bacterium]
MSRFIDTIKLADGNYKLIDHHNNRINNTINYFFGFNPGINLNLLLPKPQEEYKAGTYKCRLTYSTHIENIEIAPYSKRIIKKLKIIDLDAPDFSTEYKSLDYEFKYENRTLINSFLTGIDDISDILIIKNGLLTDTSFSNIILFDGEKWITPDTYLLNGVKRRYLLENNEIIERKISVDDLSNFQQISLINAMLEPKDITIDIYNVVF